MDLTDEELNVLVDEMQGRAANYRHYPDECDDPDSFNSLHQKVYDECRARKRAGNTGFWWVR